MSEPRTVKEWAWRYLPAEVYNALMGAKHRGNCEPHISTFLDALIGAQGRVVYTEESLLAAGHAYEDAHRAALDTNNYEAGLIAGARAAITAAGGVVADESTEIVSNRVVVELTRVIPDDDATTCTELHRGDILYIVRAKEE